ncbi:MAC/perforin domain-containing protein [Bradyrhizobium sp. SZCCHNR1015]|uniref:MAC/perforin domain-containing protein n=1 Tax=Bradyrhizobium sp. SZCCHNR1015 TaxID=3057338 RepID=UPI00291693D3|nr:MAC/perforin domain-containing protein [Bradyrhizobium sp. SZCCHNR1015]
MFREKIHIEQPDVNRPFRAGVVAARKPLVPSSPRAPGVAKHPASGAATRLPASTEMLLFHTAAHAGLKTMIINDARGFDDYRQFSSKFLAQFGVHAPPGLEVIGCGYNVFGPYAEASSLKRRLFDIGKMSPLAQTRIGNTTYSHWPIVTIHELSQSKRDTIVAKTKVEYAQKLSEKAGLEAGLLGFHAQAEEDYEISTTRDMYSAFTNVIDTTQVFSIHLDDRNDLRNYLTVEALNAIDNADGQWPPDRLFEEFGLSFVTGVIMGGRLNHMSSVDTFFLDSHTDLEVTAEADFLDLVGAGVSVQSSKSLSMYQEHSRSLTETIGGDETKGGGSIVDEASYQRWKDSIAIKPAFIDFTLMTTKKPLTAISDLAVGARRAELESNRRVFADKVSSPFKEGGLMDGAARAVNYIVTTYTGSGTGAGTDAGISIILHGIDPLEKSHESPKMLHDDGRDNHNKGAVDSIQFGPLPDLGELTKIDVIHDGKGKRGGWSLEKVEVLCRENGKIYGAFCNNAWLEGNSATFDLRLT